uniref:RRM domain-containing protein n=1 Tax=Steinernema glaseri TaxID=37863 RepID=A0A1I7ZQ97_9BILA
MPFITESEREVIFAGVERGSTEEEDLNTTIQLIEVELENGDPSSIEEAYELAVSVYPTIPLLWHKYLLWLDNSLKIPSKSVEGYERAISTNPMCTEIIQLALIAYERAGEPAERIDELWEVAKNSIEDPDWGRSLFTTYIFLLKRRIVQSGSKDFTIVEEAFNDGAAFLSRKFRYWDAQFKYRLMHAYFLYSTTKNFPKARDVLRDILASGGSTHPKVVVEAVTYERHFGRDMIRCRQMLYQAVNSVVENAYLLFDYFIQFEREEGTLDELTKAVAKVNSQAKRIQQREDQLRLQRITASPHKKKKKEKNACAIDENGLPVQSHAKRKLLAEVEEKTDERESTTRDKDGFVVPSIPPRLSKNAGTPSKKPKIDEHHSEEMEVDGISSSVGSTSAPDHPVSVKADNSEVAANNNEDTLFVSNLGYYAVEEEVAALFENVKQVRLIGNGKGKQGKGFGYVTFTTVEDAVNALKKDRIKLNGRPVFVSKYKKQKKDNDDGKSDFRYSVGLEKNKLFVSNVHFDCSEEKLKEVFAAFGEVTAVRIVTHKSGRPKGCAYVEFSNGEAARKAIDSPEIDILGRTLKIALSNPPRKDQPPANVSSMHRRIGAFSNGQNTTGGRKKEQAPKKEQTVKMSNDEFRKFL